MRDTIWHSAGSTTGSPAPRRCCGPGRSSAPPRCSASSPPSRCPSGRRTPAPHRPWAIWTLLWMGRCPSPSPLPLLPQSLPAPGRHTRASPGPYPPRQSDLGRLLAVANTGACARACACASPILEGQSLPAPENAAHTEAFACPVGGAFHSITCPHSTHVGDAAELIPNAAKAQQCAL